MVGLGLTLSVLLGACASSAFVQREGMFWHRQQEFAIADLRADGWELVHIEGADLAFHRPGHGVIAVRARCGDSKASLKWLSRHLWLGVERRDVEGRPRIVSGAQAVETVGVADGLRAHTIVVDTGRCTADLAHVGSSENGASPTFEAFVERVRVRAP